MTSFNEHLSIIQQRFESALEQRLPSTDQQPSSLYHAMRYSALDGGKRIRPALVYFTGALFDIAPDRLDGPASALEMIHVYSLVHDDLPAMDNDDLRRGKPTCHKEFDEATAILVGDALQALAFETLTVDNTLQASPEQRIALIRELSISGGHHGMVGGQVIDMEGEGKQLSLEQLKEMHRRKTGALILAAVRFGYLMADNISDDQRSNLDTYAKSIGLAFQIRDDVLDIEGNTEQLGKPQGSDSESNKSTYPELMGMDGAKEQALLLKDQAIKSLDDFAEKAQPLRDLANYIVARFS